MITGMNMYKNCLLTRFSSHLDRAARLSSCREEDRYCRIGRSMHTSLFLWKRILSIFRFPCLIWSLLKQTTMFNKWSGYNSFHHDDDIGRYLSRDQRKELICRRRIFTRVLADSVSAERESTSMSGSIMQLNMESVWKLISMLCILHLSNYFSRCAAGRKEAAWRYSG